MSLSTVRCPALAADAAKQEIKGWMLPWPLVEWHSWDPPFCPGVGGVERALKLTCVCSMLPAQPLGTCVAEC